jgi:glycosyltransferase involved in cell wall biosynthesis
MDNNEPIMVSIKCLVYNHAPYLRQCLDGFVMQKTNFRFEAIVHDDCSTDGSQEIIKEYAAKYPDIIKPIYETENQYSKHDDSLLRAINPYLTGKYIAFCEGDDYWTDPNKLQRQISYLNAHPEYVAIAENGIVLDMRTKVEKPFSTAIEHNLTISELIEKRRFPTASVVYKRNIIEQDFFTLKFHVDTIMWCYIASKGTFRYLTNISSVYRKGEQGVTESTDPFLWASTVENWNKEEIRVFGDKYDTNISKNNIYNNYLGCTLRYIYKRHFSIGFYKCLFTTIKIKPIKTMSYFFQFACKHIMK